MHQSPAAPRALMRRSRLRARCAASHFAVLFVLVENCQSESYNTVSDFFNSIGQFRTFDISA
jgi:hypothetical protein